MTLESPVFQVVGVVDAMTVALIQYHHPMFSRFIPEKAGISGIMRLPHIMRVYHRIAFVLLQGHASV